jgi:hypothetical protein
MIPISSRVVKDLNASSICALVVSTGGPREWKEHTSDYGAQTSGGGGTQRRNCSHKKKKIVLLSTTRKLGRFFASKCPTPAKSMPVTVSCNRLLVIFSNTTKQKRTESNRSMYWKRWCAEMDSVIRDCFHHNLNRMLYYQFLFINLVPHLQ